MHDLCYYFDKVVGDSEKMHELEAIACEVMRNFGIAHPELHKEAMCRMHTVVFGDHFDEELAECVVSQLSNHDGSIGAHWNRQNTDIMAKRLGIKDVIDFYVLVNVLYSKYGNVLGSDGNIYAKMALNIISSHDSNLLKMYMM